MATSSSRDTVTPKRTRPTWRSCRHGWRRRRRIGMAATQLPASTDGDGRVVRAHGPMRLERSLGCCSHSDATWRLQTQSRLIGTAKKNISDNLVLIQLQPYQWKSKLHQTLWNSPSVRGPLSSLPLSRLALLCSDLGRQHPSPLQLQH